MGRITGPGSTQAVFDALRRLKACDLAQVAAIAEKIDGGLKKRYNTKRYLSALEKFPRSPSR